MKMQMITNEQRTEFLRRNFYLPFCWSFGFLASKPRNGQYPRLLLNIAKERLLAQLDILKISRDDVGTNYILSVLALLQFPLCGSRPK